MREEPVDAVSAEVTSGNSMRLKSKKCALQMFYEKSFDADMLAHS